MKPPSPSLFPADLDSATLDAAWKGIGARRVRARRVRRALVTTPLVAALALVLLLVLRRTRSAQDSEAAAPHVGEAPHVIALASGGSLPPIWAASARSTVAFDDGSRLELAPNTRVRTIGERRDPSRVDLAVEEGSATFDVKPGGPRAWRIEAGATTVRVLGTRFVVARNGEHVHVAVERGKVRVESSSIDGGSRYLVAGQEIHVEVRTGRPEPSVIDPGVTPVDKLADAPRPSSSPAAAPNNEPRAIAGGEAPTAAPPSSGSVPPPSQAKTAPAPTAPTTRMAQADAARKAGQPREALAVLTSVVDGNEPDAALAAFTIGKIHSEELGDLAAGASWFERAIRLGLPAALDEDAHARVVECHGRAGRVDEAARAASRYEAKFPGGRHLTRVRRWKSGPGELEGRSPSNTE